MTGRRTAERVCRQAAFATLLGLSLMLVLTPAPMAGAATEVPAVATVPTVPAATIVPAVTGTPAVTTLPTVIAPTPPLSITLTAVTPTISVPKAPITIKGSIRNTGSAPITSPVARALTGRPLASRQAVSEWAASTSEPPLAEVARASLGKTLAPGSNTAFSVTIPADQISHRESFAVLPLRIAVVGTTPTQATQELGSLRTFLPVLAARKEFEPLSIAWLVPLTLDPDPALHGMDSPARTAAWTKAIGPGSRLDRLIQGTENAQVTWAIDPAILGPRQTPTAVGGPAEPSPTASPSNAPAPDSPDSPVTPDPVTEATTALANRLKAAAPRHTLWSLPYADPDFSALLPLSSANRVLTAPISHLSPLDVAIGPARTDVAWPVEGTLTPAAETRLKRAYSPTGLAAAVTSASALPSRNGSSQDASRKSSAGLPLLAYDDALSRTLNQTSSRRSGAITIQWFLADSMALLGERPGTRNRSVLIAEPRTFNGDPTALRSFFAAIDKAPWLIGTTTERLLEVSDTLDPEPPVASPTVSPSPTGTATTAPVTTAPTGGATPTAPDPMSPGTSPLTSERLEAIPDTVSAITGISSILDDGEPFRVRWTDAQDQLVSVRWRGHASGISAIEAATTAAIGRIRRNINVSPSSVNFFADKGVLQVTVLNTLSAAIHDVYLTLTPAQPRLRIEQQPGPLRIGAKSRTTVPLQVTAIAAGLVPIEAVLTTENGTPLGQSARVNVRVQPTSTWVYWVLGGLAGLVLVLGTYRSLRRGSTRASAPEAPELVIDD